MFMERGAFDDVPLHALFPQSDAGDLERMRSASRALDAKRPPAQQPLWEWAPHHAVFSRDQAPGTVAEILLTTIPIYDQEADWLEFELDVSWTREGLLCASAAVSVACWCDKDHGTHYVDPLALVVDNGISLGHAFENAANRTVSWLEDPRDPSWWRARADLPSP
ncbi:hypothetical protein AB0C21_33255 [Spirillospora sp. NPDC049024]